MRVGCPADVDLAGGFGADLAVGTGRWLALTRTTATATTYVFVMQHQVLVPRVQLNVLPSVAHVAA
jgi:hypothetical protein